MHVSSQVMHEGINLSALAKALLSDGRYTTKSLGVAIGLSQPSVSRLARGLTREIGTEAGLRLITLAGGEVRMPDLAEAREPANAA
jgi:hypothetical protein